MALKGLKERRKSAAQPAADPENAQWLQDAATNVAALTAKQRYELKRVRGRYDLHAQEIDQALAKIAERFHTSKSQVASFLLAFAVTAYIEDVAGDGDLGLWELIADAKTPARTLQYEWSLELPYDWIEALRTFLEDGPD